MPRSTAAAGDVSSRILVVRAQRVMLDSDLAQLYGATTKRLLQAVKRNVRRFPEDFMFRLADQEVANGGRGGRRGAYYVFTEQGVAMLSSVLRSESAIAVNIAINS